MLLVILVALGGFTRLSGSGLSMVEWQPLGLAPPIGEQQWREQFAAYRSHSQFQLENPSMTLRQFKRIYLIEYAHRALARVFALVFLLPFIWFSIRGRLSRPQWLFLLAVGGLIGIQGLLGWRMVRSGLGEVPMVAPYLLAAHLSLAMLIYGCLLWATWNFQRSGRLFSGRVGKFIGRLAVLLPLLVLVTIFSGGLSTGSGAPSLTSGTPIPEGMPSGIPLWLGWGEGPTVIHFTHRLAAAVLLLVCLPIALRLMASSNVRLNGGGNWLLFAIVLQVGLGLATVIHDSHWILAWLHQLGGILLFTVGLRIASVVRL